MTLREELRLREETFHEYVGHFVKRFYAPYTPDHIYKIDGHRVSTYKDVTEKDIQVHEYLYSDGRWYDCEDSCIITNELPMRDTPWVANVNNPEYKGYNPFSKQSA